VTGAVPAALVAQLLVAVSGYTGDAIPGDLPTVIRVPHATLEAMACGHPCAVLGYTAPDGTVTLDDKLRIGTDAADTSILVHELTHVLQRATAGGAPAADCAEWLEREREAYDVQYRWLHDTAPNIRELSFRLVRLGTHPLIPPCRPGEGVRQETSGMAPK
jgi:hypothetical protein